ncbi:aldehyde dehydrogenase family protein [Actinomycetota bacterium]
MSGAIVTVDPASGEELARYEAFTPDQVSEALEAAHAAYLQWSGTTHEERAALLRQVGRLLTERREEYAALITSEMGKPLPEALGEIDKCALNCEIVAERAHEWLADHEAASSAVRSWISYVPLGVVFAVMPWNFPFWQVLRFACAAIAAGDAAVLKHSPNVTGCALAVERLFVDAGAPEGLFGTVLIAEDEVPERVPAIIADRRVAAVTLTGSERAGAAVGSAAGAALKKSVLELGGSDPFVVLEGADIDAAADAAVRSRFGNSGQSCIAAKRFIVVQPVADEFAAKVRERVAALVVGDPTEPETAVGPMARADLLDGLHRQVEAAVAEGATLVTGGRPLDRPGAYYAPTLLDDVRPGTTTFREEVFGPVASIVRARDEDDAVALANDTDYGLGAAVWGPPDRALAVGGRIRSGALFVNAVTASDPRLPFGGIGRSGYGRELAAEGVREFTNVRTVYVGDAGSALPVVTE